MTPASTAVTSAWTSSRPPTPRNNSTRRTDCAGGSPRPTWFPKAPLDHIAPPWLVGFRELRGHIGQLVRGEQDRKPDSRPFDISLARVNELARAATPALRAVRTDDGTLTRALDHTPDCAALLALIARDTVELLTDPVACAGLRRCAGDNCPIVYVDTSRGRRRRWCSSEICGNRERVARHRRRAALARA